MTSARGAGLSIRPLDADTWDGLAALFAEGGDPRWCWCMWWRLRAKDFSAAKVPGLRDRLRTRAEAGPAPGLVAFDGDRAVGWVSLGPRAEFERLARSRTIPAIDDRPAWSVVCFVVSATARRRGVARALLRAAIEHARQAGASVLEAYPVDAGEAGVSDETAYAGTVRMFLDAGFRVVAPTASKAATPRVVVRAEL